MSATKEFDVEIWKRNLRETPAIDDKSCTRWFNNYFAFWLACGTKACKRARRCAGDADACRDRWMPEVPQRMKFELRATLNAINDKLPLEAVTRKVAEELARFDEITRVLERYGGASATSAPLRPSPSPGGGGSASMERSAIRAGVG
jgi:hypothetical protein